MAKFRRGMRVEVPWNTGVAQGTVTAVLAGDSLTVVVVDVEVATGSESNRREVGFDADVVRPLAERAAS